jgi:hypothetical protein
MAGLSWVALATPGAHAQTTTLFGWTAQADANAFDIVVDNAAGLSGSHPVTEADIPEDSSDYETGPFGHGLASVVWPGATAGNLGSLSGELGLPAQIAPLAAKGNDTIKAETLYPAGPETASYPSGVNTGGVAEMTSTANANGVSASSALSNVSLSNLFDLQGSEGSTTTSAGSTAKASATGTFAGASILDGLITIGATTSTATAVSNGTAPTGTATTHLGAITVAGQSVTIGSDGLVVGPATSNILGIVLVPTVGIVNQLISALDLKITPLPQTVTSQGTVESITAAGLLITLNLPANENTSLNCSALPAALSQLSVICTLPGELQGATVAITIGRSTATAIATPPFVIPALTTPPSSSVLGLTTPSSSSVTVPTLGGGSGTDDSTSNSGGSGTSPAVAPGSPSLAEPSPSPANLITKPASLAGLNPISLSSPVTGGTLVFLLVLAALISAGMIRAGRHLEDPPITSICPLNEESQ